MAGNICDYLANELLDHALGVGAFAMPGSLYLALFTVAPDQTGGGTEVVGGIGYARLEFNGATGRAFDPAAARLSDNSAQWDFAAATGDWGTLVAWAIVDAAAGAANFFFWGPFTPNRTVSNGDTFKIAAGDLDVSFSDDP